MKLLQWRYSLLLMPVMFWLPAGNIQAASLGVTCSAAMNTEPGGIGTVNLGTITTDNVRNARITGMLKYSCTNNSGTAGHISVCLAVDGGSYKPSVVSPRYMAIDGATANTRPRLEFSMTLLDGAQGVKTWGTRSFGTSSEYFSGILPMAANTTPILGEARVEIALTSASGNNNATASQGTYISDFRADGRTALTFKADTNKGGASCLDADTPAVNRFPFIVQAAVQPDCKITTKPSNIDLKSVSASATDIKGETSIGVTCTNGGNYYIGLAPMIPNPNSDPNSGSGLLKGAGNDPDMVPYQLFSDFARTKKWGNTATSTMEGNGVADIGTGSPQSLPIYVTVPSADFKPDIYSDTVNIRVNY